MWRAAPCSALLIVPVSDTYVSPSWYPSKAEHGKVVPTWNYEVVHVHGELVAHDDPVWVEQLVRDLTALNESRLSEPWSVDDAPADYIVQMVRGIVGVERSSTRSWANANSAKPAAADVADIVWTRHHSRSWFGKHCGRHRASANDRRPSADQGPERHSARGHVSSRWRSC